MLDRYFAAVVILGHLYVPGVGGSGQWDRKGLRYRSGRQLDHRSNGRASVEKINTAAELETAIKEPWTGAVTRDVWIHETLEQEARQWWETAEQCWV